jgi:hypothetical protein
MNTRPQFAALLLGSLLMTGCATGPTVVTDKAPEADLSAYKTFAFYDRVATDNAAYSSILSSHLKQSTRRELERLGYVYDEANPELRVNFFLKVQEQREIRGTGTPSSGGFYGYRFYSAGGFSIDTVEYKTGTLSIDLVDANRNALVWHGLAEGVVHDEAMENPGAAIGSVVAEIFSAFPGSTP